MIQHHDFMDMFKTPPNDFLSEFSSYKKENQTIKTGRFFHNHVGIQYN